ncbi:MAG: thiamine diphosphokinase [Deltaproteobacteria bacterium]|nr:thiamine diphosphokinase [Deltaproteobacteria bacterium]
MKAALFLGGELKKTPRLIKLAQSAEVVVAADHGALNALKLGIQPDHIVGDLDSLPSKELKKFKKAQIHRYPSKKDKSDGELALELLLSKKPKEIIIFGTIGGRPDHSLAALYLLASIPSSISAKMVSHDFELFFTEDLATIHGKKRDLVSLLPQNSTGAKVTTSGLAYPLKNQSLSYSSRGLSNQMTQSKVSIHLLRGALFIFHKI